MQRQYGTSNLHLSATLDLIKGPVGDLIRSGAKMPKSVSESDKLLQKEVPTATCHRRLRHTSITTTFPLLALISIVILWRLEFVVSNIMGVRFATSTFGMKATSQINARRRVVWAVDTIKR